MSSNQDFTYEPSDGFHNAPPKAGGSAAVYRAEITPATAAGAVVMWLPRGAVIVDSAVIVTAAFDTDTTLTVSATGGGALWETTPVDAVGVVRYGDVGNGSVLDALALRPLGAGTYLAVTLVGTVTAGRAVLTVSFVIR